MCHRNWSRQHESWLCNQARLNVSVLYRADDAACSARVPPISCTVTTNWWRLYEQATTRVTSDVVRSLCCVELQSCNALRSTMIDCHDSFVTEQRRVFTLGRIDCQNLAVSRETLAHSMLRVRILLGTDNVSDSCVTRTISSMTSG